MNVRNGSQADDLYPIPAPVPGSAFRRARNAACWPSSAACAAKRNARLKPSPATRLRQAGDKLGIVGRHHRPHDQALTRPRAIRQRIAERIPCWFDADIHWRMS